MTHKLPRGILFVDFAQNMIFSEYGPVAKYAHEKNHISQALLGMVDVVFALELNYDEKL